MSLCVGDRLGHYEVTALIGQGGMGEVYRARATKLGRDVALKVLPDFWRMQVRRRVQMSHRLLASVGVLANVIAVVPLAPVPIAGQTQTAEAHSWTVPRTPDGRPDLQGYWTTQTFTPLQRPASLAGKEFFTEEEAAELTELLTAQVSTRWRGTCWLWKMKKCDADGPVKPTRPITTMRSG